MGVPGKMFGGLKSTENIKNTIKHFKMGVEVFLMYILRHFANRPFLDFSNPHLWHPVNHIYLPHFQPTLLNRAIS